IGVVRPASASAEPPSEGKLRELLELLDPVEAPALGEDVVGLCEWLSDYYVAPIGECYRLALPATAMGADARRARLTVAGLELLERDAGPLLSDPADDALDSHDRRLLAHLRESAALPDRAGLSVASLTGERLAIPGVL